MKAGSWVVTDKETGKAVLEVFTTKSLAFVNRAKYNVETILEYLGRINSEIKAKATVTA